MSRTYEIRLDIDEDTDVDFEDIHQIIGDAMDIADVEVEGIGVSKL